jgi:hypothetical protein
MAYTLPNTGILRPWNYSKNRYIHRSMVLTVGGSGKGGGSTGTASDTISIPCPGRLVAISYGKQHATDKLAGAPVAPTGGALVLKAETTAGAQIWTDGNLASVNTAPLPVGTTAKDEGNAATAATDGFSGGFPVRQGVFGSITGGTDGEIIYVDMWFRLCTWIKLELISQSGADGSGVVTRSVPLGNAGVLSAIAVDYQNITAGTCDFTIKNDSTNGMTLFSTTDSVVDVPPTLLGRPGADEAINVTAATDGTESGNAFKTGLFFDVAGSDAFTSGDEKIIVECWIDD